MTRPGPTRGAASTTRTIQTTLAKTPSPFASREARNKRPSNSTRHSWLPNNTLPSPRRNLRLMQHHQSATHSNPQYVPLCLRTAAGPANHVQLTPSQSRKILIQRDSTRPPNCPQATTRSIPHKPRHSRRDPRRSFSRQGSQSFSEAVQFS